MCASMVNIESATAENSLVCDIAVFVLKRENQPTNQPWE